MARFRQIPLLIVATALVITVFVLVRAQADVRRVERVGEAQGWVAHTRSVAAEPTGCPADSANDPPASEIYTIVNDTTRADHHASRRIHRQS
jgi:hypothetical protein